MRWLISTLVWTSFACGLVVIADDRPGEIPGKARSSLDDQLLKELDNPLLEGLEDKPTATPTSDTASESDSQNRPGAKASTGAKKSEDSTRSSRLDDDLLRDLGGEDIGRPSSRSDPLVGIGRQMRSVEERLTERRLDDQTQIMQKQILTNLTALMQECKKQCQGGGGNKPGSKSGKAGKAGQGGGSPASQAPSDTARNSSDKLRERNTEQESKGDLVNAMKESWGNLPEHMRKHISNVTSDTFLPKYELMLEKYFKRLGEDDSSER